MLKGFSVSKCIDQYFWGAPWVLDWSDAFTESVFILTCFCVSQFSVFLGLIFFLELTAGILAFVFKDWIKDQLNLFINNNVKAYRDDIDLQNLIDFAQEYVSQQLFGLTKQAKTPLWSVSHCKQNEWFSKIWIQLLENEAIIVSGMKTLDSVPGYINGMRFLMAASGHHSWRAPENCFRC